MADQSPAEIEREACAKLIDERIAQLRADASYWGGPDMTNSKILVPELETLASQIRARK